MEAKITKEIRWQGPYPMFPSSEKPLIFDIEAARVSGIYLWAVRLYDQDKYLPLYVGMSTRSIARRQREHVESFLGGKYWIYDAESLKQGKKRYVMDYDPQKGLSVFLSLYPKLSPHLIAQLQTIQVFVAPIDGDKVYLEQIESRLIKLYQEYPATSVFLDNSRLSVCLSEDFSPSIPILGGSSIIGMPSAL